MNLPKNNCKCKGCSEIKRDGLEALREQLKDKPEVLKKALYFFEKHARLHP